MRDQRVIVSPKVSIPFQKQKKRHAWTMIYCRLKGFDSITEKTSCIVGEPHTVRLQIWNACGSDCRSTTNRWISNVVCSTCTRGSQYEHTHLQWSKGQTLGPRVNPCKAQEASEPTNPWVSIVRSWKQLTQFDVNHGWHASILQTRKCIWKSKSEYMIKGILFESSMETAASTQWAERGSP